MKYNYEKDNFTKIVKESLNLSDVCRKLNIGTTKGNRDTVKKYIDIYKINVDHFNYSKHNTHNKKKLNDVLKENSTYCRKSLKKRLYKEGLKERKCELCGQDENWNNMKISLIIDHINGINNDNRLENLRIICPNCNAGLDTFSGKNINKKYKYNIDLIKNYKHKYNYKKNTIKNCKCGKLILNSSTVCSECNSLSQRRVKRPPYEQLLNEIKELGYSGTGRKYNVSDVSIRKWKKNYEKQIGYRSND